MKEPIWLNREDCLSIHEMMLGQYGGLAGVRDEGLLESAITRPQNLLAYGSAKIADLAASYAAGIIRNHPFLDGNNRTGFMVTATFLETNGMKFIASEESVVAMTLALAAGEMGEKAYADWLKQNSRRS